MHLSLKIHLTITIDVFEQIFVERHNDFSRFEHYFRTDYKPVLTRYIYIWVFKKLIEFAIFDTSNHL